MVKRNTNFTMGLNRQELKSVAMKLGKTQSQVNKASTKTLENFIRRSQQPTTKTSKSPTSRKINTQFTLGANRQELKQLAKDLGSKANVNKSSTKSLENFIKNQLSKGGKVKDFIIDEKSRKDIESFFKLGYTKGKSYLSTKISRLSKSSTESYEKVSIEIANQFSAFFRGHITDAMVEELFNRFQAKYIGEVWNKLLNTFEYFNILEEYAMELEGQSIEQEGE